MTESEKKYTLADLYSEDLNDRYAVLRDLGTNPNYPEWKTRIFETPNEEEHVTTSDIILQEGIESPLPPTESTK